MRSGLDVAALLGAVSILAAGCNLPVEDSVSDVSLAELRSAISACAAIQGDQARLECFDQVDFQPSGDTAVASTSHPASAVMNDESIETLATRPAPVDRGDWIVRTDINPLDDTTTVLATLFATSGQSSWGDDIVFNARCKSNETEAYIIWHDYVGDDSDSVYSTWKYVTVRIGDGEQRQAQWSVSTDNEATFAPDWAGTLLQEMAQSDRFIAQMTPYGESPVVAIFDTTGMAAALEPLASECGWAFN